MLATVSVGTDALPRMLAWCSERGWGAVDDIVFLLAASHLVMLGFGVRRCRDLRRQLDRGSRTALCDPLTGLPNRAAFFPRLAAATEAPGKSAASAPACVTAVLLLDIDDFSDVNDLLGHAAGDVLLQAVAERLAVAARETDSVARLGGDKFAVLLPCMPDLAAVDTAASRFVAALSEPLPVLGTHLRVSVSVGVTVQGRDGSAPDELVRRTEAAARAAKRGGGGVVHYDPERDDAATRLAALAELRDAIEIGQLRLHYQAGVQLSDGRVTGAEALVRWEHPTRGLLPPMAFLPLAEQSELITPLTAWVLDEGVRQCRAWVDEGLDLCVAVNLSARTVVDEGLPQLVRSALQIHGLAPSRLALEITETSLISRPDDARRILTELSALGVNISVDDFGTGYATLAWLQQLPFNALKIDRTFVAEVTAGGPGAELVRYTAQLAHAMGSVVVAEGVEDDETWAALREMGCDMAQGFGISRPLPSEAFRAWLLAWTGEAPSPTPGNLPKTVRLGS